MIKRYYFYSANFHSNENNPAEITGYVSGVVIFTSLLPIDPLTIRRSTVEFICKGHPHLKDNNIHFLSLERFKT